MNAKTIVFFFCLLYCCSSCSIGRIYKGTPVAMDLVASIQKGKTMKGDILTLFGAPSQILSQTDGDIFIYEYKRENSTELEISSPLVAVGGSVTFFTYTKNDSKSDSLVILFDRAGIVTSFGYTNETQKLKFL
ncbi:MAG: hypothetical protein AABZ60_19475 [Planctomycetota bacterium]